MIERGDKVYHDHELFLSEGTDPVPVESFEGRAPRVPRQSGCPFAQHLPASLPPSHRSVCTVIDATNGDMSEDAMRAMGPHQFFYRAEYDCDSCEVKMLTPATPAAPAAPAAPPAAAPQAARAKAGSKAKPATSVAERLTAQGAELTLLRHQMSVLLAWKAETEAAAEAVAEAAADTPAAEE